MTLLRITHYTLTSALGHGRAAHHDALLSGNTGLRKQSFDTCNIDCWIGEVNGLQTALPDSLKQFECRNQRLAWLGLQQDGFMEAVARLREKYDTARIGVFMGTSTAGIHSAELAYRERRGKEDSANSSLPDWFDYQHTQNLYSIADFVKQALNLNGHSLVISTACSSSAKVFAAAYRSMQLGSCDAAIVGGVDSLCLTTLYGFNSLQLVSSDICRPADANRRGISIGEAAGFAIVEKPGATADGTALPYALLGYGESGDAHHMSSPDPQGTGAAMSMRLALSRASLQAEAVDYINLHGTGTQANDAAEDKGVVTVLGPNKPCSSTKGWTGHTLGAAGIMEAGISLLCIEHGLLPCSLNTRNKDSQLQANVLMKTQQRSIKHVMSNSFGFGGSNCSLLLGRMEQ
ncbi:MAG: beta-ketoacyl-[acyl-carrier-protein] synthase family protein [Steroidobacter sp.]